MLTQEELEAYFKAAENYSEIIKLMEGNDDFLDFAKVMQEKFSFTWNQCKYFTYMSIQDLYMWYVVDMWCIV